ncbi:MAG: CotH kinase family protein [Lewinella sp.]
MSVYIRTNLLVLWLLPGVFFGANAGAMEGLESNSPTAHPAGFYDRPVEVFLPLGVRYTLDGSTPSSTSPIYETAFTVHRTTLVRYAAFDDGGERTSDVYGSTYFIDEPASRLATLSVGIDPWRLFNGVNGWFRAGPGADPGHWKKPGANWWTKKEHPAHFDLIETDGEAVFSGTVGFRMFGGMSRLHPQKSFSLSARKRYGKKRIKHKIFGDAAGKSFQFLVARNAGSDWNRSYLRDALLTSLLQDESWDLERQAARPVQVYINGKYWGIYHLREKINPQFIRDRHPEVDKNKIDFLEHQQSVKHGKMGTYGKLLRFVESTDLSQPEPYRKLGELMDIDNYQRLQIAQTYFDNRDAGGNIRFWRPQTPDGRWRWILYDVDQGFGLHSDDGYTRNTLAFYTDDNGPSWPNPPWSTLLQRKLLTNPDYRRLFANRTLDYLHTDFSPVTVAAAIERRVAGLEFDMPRQLDRWEGKDKHWRFHLDRIRAFGQQRPAHLREHLRAFFNGGEDRQLSLIATPGGYVELNKNIRIDEASYSGTYFQNLPLHLRAVAHNGFRFVGWEGTDNQQPELELPLNDRRNYALKALFEPLDHPQADRIIFNEVHPAGKAGGDWIELYNRSDITVDLTGWLLTDATHNFRLPTVQIFPGNYLVICTDAERFHRSHPQAYNVIGGLSFGLDKDNEALGLYGPDGGYVNTLTYKIPDPDTAFTYALVLPGLDHADPRHWAIEPGSGSPAAANPDYLEAAVLTRQDYWLRIGVGLGVLVLIGVFRGLRQGRALEEED